MSSIKNDAASINAPAVDSAGSITPPSNPATAAFMRSNLAISTYPAMSPGAGGSAGGHVANVARLIVDAAGGPLNRR